MEKQEPVPGTDAIRINVRDSSELKYWADKFGVSQNEIRLAVADAGDSLTAVKLHLAHPHHA